MAGGSGSGSGGTCWILALHFAASMPLSSPQICVITVLRKPDPPLDKACSFLVWLYWWRGVGLGSKKHLCWVSDWILLQPINCYS